MSLFDGLLEPMTPAAAPAVPAERPCLVTIKRASNGDEIMLCTVSPAPAAVIAEAEAANLPLFTVDEIPALRRMAEEDPASIDLVVRGRREGGYGGPLIYKRLDA